ncbi:hypothetical protein ACUY4R_000381 [Kosakonia sp. BK9b]
MMIKIKWLLLVVALFIVVKVIFFIATDDNKTKDVTAVTATAIETPHEGYKRYEAGYGLSLELPEAWVLMSAEQAKEVDKASASATGMLQSEKILSLTANANREGKLNTATVKVTFTDNMIERDDLRHFSRGDVDDVCEVITTSITPALKKINSELTSAVNCSLSSVNGTPAFLAEFHRKGILDNDDWEMKNYQIPLEEKTAVLTVSYNTTSQASKDEIEKVLRSVQFH